MPRPNYKTQVDPLAFDAGELRHQVRLVHLSATQDGFGQPVNDYSSPYRTTMASIRLLSGQELYQGGEFSSAAQWRIRMRWTDDNTVVGDRIVFGARVFVIQICDNLLQRNRVLQLTCLEINGAS